MRRSLRRRWTAAEDRLLLEARAKGRSARMIARDTKRTIQAVNTRIFVLKNKTAKTANNPFTALKNRITALEKEYNKIYEALK